MFSVWSRSFLISRTSATPRNPLGLRNFWLFRDLFLYFLAPLRIFSYFFFVFISGIFWEFRMFQQALSGTAQDYLNFQNFSCFLFSDFSGTLGLYLDFSRLLRTFSGFFAHYFSVAFRYICGFFGHRLGFFSGFFVLNFFGTFWSVLRIFLIRFRILKIFRDFFCLTYCGILQDFLQFSHLFWDFQNF